MKSTAWKEIGAEFELEGQRKTLAQLITDRLEARGEPLVARLATCGKPCLDQVTHLIAKTRDDDELAKALDAVLPPAPPQEPD